MKALDLFCGLGGWSDGLALEGFEVLGVEIKPMIAKLYQHKVIVQDVQKLEGKNFKNYDLIVGSPPCRDFSIIGRLWGHTWKRAPDLDYGLINVNAFLKFVEDANPKYWLMENVPNLQEYIGKARTKSYLGVRSMRRCFWGNYPSFLIPQTIGKTVYSGMHRYRREKRKREGKIINLNQKAMGKWKSAKIPLPVARALGRAVKQELMK